MRNVRLASLAAMAGSLCLPFGARAGIVTNGGFETGDFTSWTLTGNIDSNTFIDSNSPHTGTFAAALGPFGSLAFISQDLATTIGSQYTVSLWLQSDGLTPNRFTVDWNGVNIYDFSDTPVGPYTLLQFTNELATSTTTTLKIGFQNDNGFLSLDDIDVADQSAGQAATPEPSTFVLAGLGLCAAAALSRRTHRVTAKCRVKLSA